MGGLTRRIDKRFGRQPRASNEQRNQGIAGVVEERSLRLRRCAERHAGGMGSANADMSSDKGSEKLPRRKPKVSCATFIGAG